MKVCHFAIPAKILYSTERTIIYTAVMQSSSVCMLHGLRLWNVRGGDQEMIHRKDI